MYQQFEILDIITILSFALQLQNADSRKINEVSNKLDKDIKGQLDRIESKLDKLLATHV